MEGFVILPQDGGKTTVVFYRALRRRSFHVTANEVPRHFSSSKLCKTALREYYAAIHALRFQRRN